MKKRDNRRTHRDDRVHSSSPGIPYGHQGDITVWTELQDTVLRLDADPTELDVLRRVCAHTRVLLHTGWLSALSAGSHNTGFSMQRPLVSPRHLYDFWMDDYTEDALSETAVASLTTDPSSADRTAPVTVCAANPHAS
ncbi:hypothetical protein EYF80_011356 [Liparis tanakae]|uniref:Uncharacterized protein n=1 Tax=Liparis tanakae TaxID=230148 RepID=A0A4Z2IME6_9TELE|nr:hypothetical protein EYF80_011356 [Liparis tanakae]